MIFFGSADNYIEQIIIINNKENLLIYIVANCFCQTLFLIYDISDIKLIAKLNSNNKRIYIKKHNDSTHSII